MAAAPAVEPPANLPYLLADNVEMFGSTVTFGIDLAEREDQDAVEAPPEQSLRAQ